MIECKTDKDCFYGGSRHRKGDTVIFKGAKKDLPSYLIEVKKPKAKG